MKRITIHILIAAIAFTAFICPESIRAQIVTRDQARTVAENYISLIIESTGSWGESSTASVAGIDELRRGERLLGYWCHIEPAGHVVVSLHTALAPVKAGSETWDADSGCDADIIDVIKYKIERQHDLIEERIGPVETAAAAEVASLGEIDYRAAWALFGRDSGDFERSRELLQAGANYQEGSVMLSTRWNQTDPYNLFMPATTACSPGYDNRCAAGCVAIAAGQIMKYWDWPPYGVGVPYNDYYDWTLMPDNLTTSSPYQQIDETALFIVEVAQACNMDYCSDGTCSSSATHVDMRNAFMNIFRFSGSAWIVDRVSYSSDGWFDLIRSNINSNMPMQYGVPDHSIVCDGWRVVSDIKQYHMNYGWGNHLGQGSCWDPYIGIGSNTWYTLDAMPCTDLSDEEAIVMLMPSGSLNTTLSGTYGRNSAFPYRYVNVDAGGESAVFQAGQLIQSLPGLTITCTSASSGTVKFYGSPTLHTRIFTRGDTSKGVKITDGCVALYGSGVVKMY